MNVGVSAHGKSKKNETPTIDIPKILDTHVKKITTHCSHREIQTHPHKSNILCTYIAINPICMLNQLLNSALEFAFCQFSRGATVYAFECSSKIIFHMQITFLCVFFPPLLSLVVSHSFFLSFIYNDWIVSCFMTWITFQFPILVSPYAQRFCLANFFSSLFSLEAKNCLHLILDFFFSFIRSFHRR